MKENFGQILLTKIRLESLVTEREVIIFKRDTYKRENKKAKLEHLMPPHDVYSFQTLDTSLSNVRIDMDTLATELKFLIKGPCAPGSHVFGEWRLDETGNSRCHCYECGLKEDDYFKEQQSA